MLCAWREIQREREREIDRARERERMRRRETKRNPFRMGKETKEPRDALINTDDILNRLLTVLSLIENSAKIIIIDTIM